MIVTVYAFASIVFVVTAFISAGFLPALCALGASAISVVCAAAVVRAIRNKNPDLTVRVVTILAGIGMLGFAYWLSTGFSIRIFHQTIDGQFWALIGGYLGFLIGSDQIVLESRDKQKAA